MKVQFKFVVLFLLFHSVLHSASICSDRGFVNAYREGVLRSGADGYCQGNTFYIVAQVHSQSDFNEARQNLNASTDLLARGCSLFKETLRAVNSLQNSNLRGNVAFVYEYNGQRVQYSCP